MSHATRAATLAILILTALVPAVANAAGPKTIGTMTFVGRPGLSGIAVVGFTWAVRNTPSAGGGGAVGKVTFDPFRVVKLLDGTAPALFDLTARGTRVEEVRVDVTVRRGTTTSYVLNNVAIVANERRTENGAAVQELSLSAVQVRETVTTAGGTVTTCFSLATLDTCD